MRRSPLCVLASVRWRCRSSASAWGFEAHKFIADRMIALLPAELKPLFEKRRAFIVERAIDPDLWRNVGWEEEPPNHFLDFDLRGLRPVSVHGAAARLRRRGAEVRQGGDPRAGPAAVAHGRVLRAPAARVRVAEASARARLRDRQHRALRGHPRALRLRRSRAAARRRELQRPAHRTGRPALAVGIRAVRAQSRAKLEDRAGRR